MSAWKILIPDLHAAGGGPLQLKQFDARMCGRDGRTAMARTAELGLVCVVRRRLWVLTPLGYDYCTGKAVAVQIINGQGGTVTRIVPALSERIPDEVIERVLWQVGHQPGRDVTPDVMRAYSAALAAELRRVPA